MLISVFISSDATIVWSTLAYAFRVKQQQQRRINIRCYNIYGRIILFITMVFVCAVRIVSYPYNFPFLFVCLSAYSSIHFHLALCILWEPNTECTGLRGAIDRSGLMKHMEISNFSNCLLKCWNYRWHLPTCFNYVNSVYLLCILLSSEKDSSFFFINV